MKYAKNLKYLIDKRYPQRKLEFSLIPLSDISIASEIARDVRKEKRDEIQAELSVDTGGEKNILVLGQDDLKEERLIEKLGEFIK